VQSIFFTKVTSRSRWYFEIKHTVVLALYLLNPWWDKQITLQNVRYNKLMCSAYVWPRLIQGQGHNSRLKVVCHLPSLISLTTILTNNPLSDVAEDGVFITSCDNSSSLWFHLYVKKTNVHIWWHMGGDLIAFIEWFRKHSSVKQLLCFLSFIFCSHSLKW